MRDMYGTEVKNGDFLVEGNEEFCYIFLVENNKPILIAKESIVYNNLIKYSIGNFEELDAEMKENEQAPPFLKNYFKRLAERMQDINPESLMKVDNKNIYEKFFSEGHEEIRADYNFNEGGTTYYFPDAIITNKF